jgi:Fic-DOC domain mobile mystery protein B
MTDLFQEPEGATNLSPEERDGLLQTWITDRDALNKAEAQNILDGTAWARGRRGTNAIELLNDEYVKALHKQMFGDVWSWAGKYRERETNLGVQPYLISTAVPALFDEARYWVEQKSYEPDELAVRLKHRLVFIHPFPNGNGRHTRLLADLVIERLGGERFTWGHENLTGVSELRTRYMAALRAADNHDIGPLLKFARS